MLDWSCTSGRIKHGVDHLTLLFVYLPTNEAPGIDHDEKNDNKKGSVLVKPGFGFQRAPFMFRLKQNGTRPFVG